MFRVLSVIFILLLGLTGAACQKPGGAGTSAKKELAPNAVKVEMYVMSQCPYGVQAVDGIKPAIDQLGKYVDLRLDYIVTPKGGGEFQSLHGQPEVEGNIAQLCAINIAPDKYMEFISCQNKNYRDIQNNWKQCAVEAKIDAQKLEACKNGEEGKRLLTASAERATKAGARGSPTIKIADQEYQGGRRANDFLKAICNAMTGEKPKVCTDIPPPVKVALVYLNDARCEECKRSEVLIERIKGTFPGLEVKKLDYGTEEGKQVYKESGLKYLPAFLFDESAEKDAEGYAQIGRFLEPMGNYKSLKVGSTFDPTAEICNNNIDDTGNGKIDCDDETCKEQLICRPEKAKRLDVFVMSQCPYGVKALDAMEEVLKNFDKKIDFNVHFIADYKDGKFSALHGQPEVDENIRELCAIKLYPKDYKYMDYILCRNKNIRSANWQECTGKNGIDTKKMEACFTGEGQKLLEDNIKLANSLGIGASPTWLANNKHKFSGIDAETIKRNFCQHNAGTKGCENTLSGNTGAPAGSCN